MSKTPPPKPETLSQNEIGHLASSLSPDELAELGLRGEHDVAEGPALGRAKLNDPGVIQAPVAPVATSTRSADVRPVQFAPLAAPPSGATRHTIDLLLDVELKLTAELGQTRLTIREILELGAGSIIELNRLAGEPVDVMVNNTLIARGEVVVVDDKFGIRILDVVSPAKRISSLM